MTIPVCPSNKLLVQFGEKYVEKHSANGVDLFIDTSFRPEQHTTIQGNVVSLPKQLSDNGLGGYLEGRSHIGLNIKPGDQVLFNYNVVFSMSETDNRKDVFYQDPPHPYLTTLDTWSNQNGLRLARVYEQNNKWTCVLIDHQGTIQDHMKGGELEVNTWMGKFTFEADVQKSHRNLLVYNGQEYWMVDISQVFGVVRDGHIYAVGDYVVISPRSKPIHRNQETDLFVYKLEQDTDTVRYGQVMSKGNAGGIEEGDNVLFDGRYVIEYEYDKTTIWVVKRKFILGTYDNF